jgi:hypothetical protein
MTVISASYKTDIPAFYGDWFRNRLDHGFVDVRNPYNNKLSRLSISPADVDAFVFWTRNAAPFLPVLSEKIEKHFPFYFQFTVTGYPKPIERSVIDDALAIQQIRDLSIRYGPHAVVWRYDPIFISELTPEAYHKKNFQRLARQLAGSVNEVTVSFTQLYAKTKRNLAQLEARYPVGFVDPSVSQKEGMVAWMQKSAKESGMRLTLCTQPHLEISDIRGAACIDGDRLSKVGCETRLAGMQKNRDGCLCISSRDIGSYDTCPHGCVYCYAVQSPSKVRAAVKNHDRSSSVL